MSVGPKLSATTRPTSTRTTSQTSRSSISGPTSQKDISTSRFARPSLAGHRPSTQARVPSRQEEPTSQDLVQSPTIEEEDDAEVDPSENGEDEQDEAEHSEQLPNSESVPVPESVRTISTSHNTGASHVEARTAQQRELEELKAKLRGMEKKQQDDHERLQQLATVQGERDKYEKIVQALQKRAHISHQEIVNLRSRCEEAEAEAKANVAAAPSGEHESEMELATIDKEMAEERAENFRMELEALKSKHEELELEVDILREENNELSSVMSPEEKASAGWLQMERERQRLREALVMLRDMSQQTESDLKNEIKELTDNLEEAEATANMYTDTAGKLSRAEETNRHLMEQLEAAETNDEVVEAMEVQREQQTNVIEQLKRQVQDLEEHIQVTDELEIFHVDEEKRLHVQLNDTEALLNESNRRTLEQDKVVEDLEYTLTKFRDVVQGLQNDINELRRSKDISEQEAHEMSSKSRAMMDLNMRLQNNAAKTQTKIIETELNRVQADLAGKHVEILSNFTIESFDAERNSVLAVLCFSRVKSKASLLGRLLAERLKERSHLGHGEEMFTTFSIIDTLHRSSGICRRFEEFMRFCDHNEFTACGRALYELEPVERTITSWLEALKRDELGPDEPEQFRRMQSVLVDLAEKLITESNQSKSMELIVLAQTAENLFDSLGSQLNTLTRIVQTALGGPTEEDQDSVEFDKRMDQLFVKVRTIKYTTSKVVQEINQLRSGSMCPSETSWDAFTDVERQAQDFSGRVRRFCLAVASEISRLDTEQPLSYTLVIEHMLAVWKTVQEHEADRHNGIHSDSDVFAALATQLAGTQRMVDDLMSKASDTNTAVEFETNVSPWVVRAKELKAQKTISTEAQQELTNLNRRNTELSSRIVEREKIIEEMTLRVELAEKRMKDTRARDDKDKAFKEEINTLKTEKQAALKDLSDIRQELEKLTQKLATDNLELESLRKAGVRGDTALPAGISTDLDQEATSQLQSRLHHLEAGTASLQAAVRFLRTENLSLRVPTTDSLLTSASTSWLDPSILPLPSRTQTSQSNRATHLQKESSDLYSHLISVASSLKPLRLSNQDQNSHSKILSRTLQKSTSSTSTPKSSWQATAKSTRYAILKQKEEIAEWDSWREDLLKRARISLNSQRADINHIRNLNPNRDGRSDHSNTRRPDRTSGPAFGNVRDFKIGEFNRRKKSNGDEDDGSGGAIVIVE